MVSMLRQLLDFQLGMGVKDFNPDVLANACRECLLLYTSLGWHMKPKVHMWQELCEYQIYNLGDPSLYWNYADESYVGFISKIASSRGGGRSPSTMPLNVIKAIRALGSKVADSSR